MISNDIRLTLYRIISGNLFFSIDDRVYEFRKISNQTKYEAELLYYKIINEEKYNEWIRLEDVEYTMTELGIWTSETNSMISKLEKSIENSKVELFNNFLYSDKTKKIRKNLESYKRQLDRILDNKNSFVSSHTLEGHAENIKNEYMVCESLFFDNQKVFDNFSDINASGSYLKFNTIVLEINKNNISMSDYRKIARSDEWRSYWSCNKSNVFNGAVCDWSDDQRSLVNITKMYDNIYEHPECPSDSIVSDDDALDGWTIVQKRKHEKSKSQNSIDNINPNLKKAQEVFLMADNKEDIDNILSLNSQESLNRMKQKVATINAVGSIDDLNMPDTQLELRNQANNQFKNRK